MNGALHAVKEKRYSRVFFVENSKNCNDYCRDLFYENLSINYTENLSTEP